MVVRSRGISSICHPGLDPVSRFLDSGSEAGMTAISV